MGSIHLCPPSHGEQQQREAPGSPGRGGSSLLIPVKATSNTSRFPGEVCKEVSVHRGEGGSPSAQLKHVS